MFNSESSSIVWGGAGLSGEQSEGRVLTRNRSQRQWSGGRLAGLNRHGPQQVTQPSLARNGRQTELSTRTADAGNSTNRNYMPGTNRWADHRVSGHKSSTMARSGRVGVGYVPRPSAHS